MDKNTLYHFFNGASTPEEDRQIVDWIDQNPANEKTFNKEREIYNTMLLMKEEDFAVVRHRKVFRMPRWTKELLRTAAAVFLAAGVGYYFYSDLERQLNMAGNSISIPIGQQLDIILPDGTKVTVNGASTITYPAIFAKKERRIRLSGEAYFAVTYKEDHPFVVETSKYDVEVLGTEFNVEAYDEENQFVTSLIEGKVKITDNYDPDASVVLSPNEQVTLRDGELVVGTIPEYEKFLWRDGLITFNKATFGQMMKLLEKYYGFQIICKIDKLPSEIFSGKIRIAEGIEHALWVLQQNSSFKYEKNADSMIITIK